MRTNIVIDQELIHACIEATGLRTKRAVVDLALRRLLETHRQGEIKKLFGKVTWEGDLEEMRTDK